MDKNNAPRQNNQNNSGKNNNSGQSKNSGGTKDYNPQKPKASNGTKIYLAILVLGLALALGGFFYKGRKAVQNNDTAANQEQPIQTQEMEQPAEPQNSNSGGMVKDGNYIEGTLERSDNPNKGNLKVISGSNVTYLRTSRDFTALIGSAVMVMIEGTIDNFKLVDIKAKVEKNGYIIPKQ